MEIGTQEKQHHEKYTYAQKECGSICTLYGENCSLERHMKWIEVVVYLNYRDEDLASKHNQRF